MSCNLHGSFCSGLAIRAESVSDQDQVVGKSGNSYPIVKVINRFGRTTITYGSGENLKTSDGSADRPIVINERVKKEYTKLTKTAK